MTLIEPAAYVLLDQVADAELSRQVAQVNRRFVRQVQQGEKAAAFKAYLAYYAGQPEAFDALPEADRGRLLSLSSTVCAALTAVHMDPTSLDDWQSIAVPTMLVYGENTDRMHRTLTRAMAETLPHSRLESVANAGHLLSLSHPAQTAQLISEHTQGR